MSTTSIPSLDMNKLNAFIGQFVTDLAPRFMRAWSSSGKSWDFTKPLPEIQ